MVGDHALLITEEVLIVNGGQFNCRHEGMTWGGSSLRRYLNGEFLNSFDSVDRTRIRKTYVVDTDNPWWYSGRSGENTMDKIFILSIDEVLRYFGDSGQLENRPEGVRWINDQYNAYRIATDSQGTPLSWWLRTSGRYIRLIASICVTGDLNIYAQSVTTDGGGARPALWLNLVNS